MRDQSWPRPPASTIRASSSTVLTHPRAFRRPARDRAAVQPP